VPLVKNLKAQSKAALLAFLLTIKNIYLRIKLLITIYNLLFINRWLKASKAEFEAKNGF
jgi:hypothetical protein